MVERVELPNQSRREREFKPRYVVLHSTQGRTSVERQYDATVSWFKMAGGLAPNNGWGPSADILIGHDGREAFFTLNDMDFHRTRANWSAGYGSSEITTYGADEYGIAIEVAQTDKGEAPTEAALQKLVGRCAYLCITFGIEPRRIPYLSQNRLEPIPSGIVGHEDTENGRKTGKWDPANFPWDEFIERLQAEIQRRTHVMSPQRNRWTLVADLVATNAQVKALPMEGGKRRYEVIL